MKKIICKSIVVAALVTTLMGIINYFLGTTFGKILGIEFGGGEIVSKYGFGIELQKHFPIFSVDNPIDTKVLVNLSPINFCLTVLVVALISFIVISKIEKLKQYK